MIHTRKNQMNSLMPKNKPQITDGVKSHEYPVIDGLNYEMRKTKPPTLRPDLANDPESLAFREYYTQKSLKIFQPDLYEYYLQGEIPKESPLLAGLQDEGKTAYVSPLPAASYERKIEVDHKYVREERPALGL